MQSLYEILELPRTATHEQIRAAFRNLSKLHHPDKGGNEEDFQQIQLAHSILSDPAKRKAYNETGQTTFTSVDNERAAVLEIMSLAIQQIVFNAQTDPAQFNFLDAVRSALNTKIQEGERALANHKIALAKLETVTSRLKSKRKKAQPDPTLLTIIAAQRKQIENTRTADEATVARFRSAKDLLADYSYDWKVPAQNNTFEQYNSNASVFFSYRK